MTDLSKIATVQGSSVVISVPALLDAVSPSGALREVSDVNDDLEQALGKIDAEEQALAHAKNPSIVARLEDDFARLEPVIDAEAPAVTSWAIPLISSFVTIPGLSIGLAVACKVALAVYDRWAKRRLAQG